MRATLTILQVKKTRLANVFHSCAALTNFSLLEAHPCTGTPSENGERACTRLAFFAISVFCLQTQSPVHIIGKWQTAISRANITVLKLFVAFFQVNLWWQIFQLYSF